MSSSDGNRAEAAVNAAAAAPPGPAVIPASTYRPDIDGLRAVAVLSVVVYHAFPQALRGGFVGVDIFFVISGYLISTIIFSQLEAGRFSFAAFYARRIRRIFPAVLVVLIACLAFGWWAMLPDEYSQLGKHVAGGMGFVSNLLLWSESGYFDAEAHAKPLLHLWSLGIEEQFYIAWPLLAWLAFKRRHGLLWLAAGVLVASFVLNVAGIGRDPVATFYSPLSRAWELAVGGLLAWAVLHRRLDPARFPAATANGLSLVGLVLLLAAVLATRAGASFPGWWAVLPVLGAAAVIAAGPGAWINRHVLANPVAVWIGLISYPLYLWHWPLLFVARKFDAGLPPAGARGLAVAASFLLAWLTYRLLERNVRHRRGPVVAVLLALGVAVVAAGLFVQAQDGLPRRAVVRDSRLSDAAAAQMVPQEWNREQALACMKEFPFQGQWWFCLKNRDTPPTLIILGNSQANQLYPGFAAHPLLAHHTVLGLGNCRFGGPRDDPGAPPAHPCHGQAPGEQLDYIDAEIAKLTSLRFAVVAGLWPGADAPTMERITRRITFLQRQGLRVILFVPYVQIGFHPRECFRAQDDRAARDCTYPQARVDALRAEFQTIVDRLAKTNPGVVVFDQNPVFCDDDDAPDTCSFVRNGLPLLRDEGSHTSDYAAGLVEERFFAWARENVPELLDPGYLETAAARQE